jgi:hypothetical protein
MVPVVPDGLVASQLERLVRGAHFSGRAAALASIDLRLLH